MSDIIKPSGQNKIWAETGTSVEPSDSKWQFGWTVERPPYQWVNFYLRKFSTTIASINQKGFPTWDNETEYRANISWSLGSNGAVYFCKVTHTNQNPVSDVSESYWRKVLDGQKVLASSAVSSYMLGVINQPSSSAALTALGMTTVGRNVATASTPTQALSSLGGSSVGINVFTSTNQATARTYLGATSIGSALFTASTTDSAQNTLGASTVGKQIFTSTSQANARNHLGAGATGGNIFTSNTPNDALNALAASTIGKNLFTASSQAAARSYIGVGSASESVEGLVLKSSDSEAIAGVNDTKYLTPKKLRLGFSISENPLSGYIRFPSWLLGFTIQWGYSVYTGNANTQHQVNFPIPFSVIYRTIGTYNNSGDTSTKAVINLYSESTTYFRCNYSLNGTHGISWVAFGRS